MLDNEGSGSEILGSELGSEHGDCEFGPDGFGGEAEAHIALAAEFASPEIAALEEAMAVMLRSCEARARSR